jgi:hypothetical protein
MKKFTLFGLFIVFLLLNQSFYAQLIDEKFEGTFPPTGWLIFNNGTGNNWTQETFGGGLSGTKCALYSYNSSNAANTWMFSKGINLSEGQSISCSFWEKVGSGYYTENMKFTVGTAQTVSAQNTVLINLPNLSNTTFVRKTCVWIAPATATYYFGFNCYSLADMHSLYVDDFKIINTICPTPTNLNASNITTSSATIGWTAAGSETLWNIQVGTSGFTPAQNASSAGTGVTNPYTLSGLTSGASYDFYVQASCGDTNSTWSGPFTFSLSFTPPSNDSCETAQNISTNPFSEYMNAQNATNNNGSVLTCGNGMNDGVWYSFTPTAPGTITLSLTNVSSWDPEMAVYTGNCGAFTCIGFADSHGEGEGESMTINVVAGTKYFINVGHYNQNNFSEGSFYMNLSGNATLDVENESLSASIKIFPNPFENDIHIQSDTIIDYIGIYNLLGQEIMFINPQNNLWVWEVSNLKTGTYLVKIQAQSQWKTYHIIKK